LFITLFFSEKIGTTAGSESHMALIQI